MTCRPPGLFSGVESEIRGRTGPGSLAALAVTARSGHARRAMTRFFRGELCVMADGPGAGAPPAHFLGQQDPPHSRAHHGEAVPAGGLGQGIQRPGSWSGLVGRGQRTDWLITLRLAL